MANRSKAKGSRFERAVVLALNAHGLNAKRVPLSGMARGFKGDVHFECQGIPKVMECKSRKARFKEIREWLGDNDFLAVKDNNTEALVVMTLANFAMLASYK